MGKLRADMAALCALLSIWICVIISGIDKERGAALPASTYGGRPVLVIDPGHGGMDGGAVSVTGKKESELNWQIAGRLYDLAGFLGIGAVMTRSTEEIDYPGELRTISARKKWDTRRRAELADSVTSGVLVSIHQNFYPASGPHGSQVLYNTVACSRSLAAAAQKRLSMMLGETSSRGAAAADKSIYVLSHISCPGILIECGFISNPREARMLESEEYQIRLAAAIAAAFYDYTGDDSA